METELGWRESIIKVLQGSNTPMHYADIAEQILEQGMRSAETATPASSVAATLTQSFQKDGQASPFIRVGRGVYALREQQFQAPQVALAELAETQSSDVTGVVNAFGMFWERSKVKWDPEPKILGSQSGAKPVNFCGQKGVYLLHDSQGVVYVGRTTDQSLGKRLYQHTTDRLTGRWTRFSWFGVFPVESSGELKLDSDFSKVDIDTVIVTMEAVLIEGLEPRQNRKRGDAEFQAIEFLQVEDPKLETNRKLSLIQELAAKLSQG
jgi:hypothetical protein